MAVIRDEILAAPAQRITFARFMERALVEPGLGYYARSALRPTRSGDFLTAPELHPFFGRCMGRFLAAAWERHGSPAEFRVLEAGAGRGTLRETALAGLAADGSALADAIAWRTLDLPGRADLAASGRSPSEAGGHAASAAGGHAASAAGAGLLGSRGAGEPRADVVLANEFLDALPVHRLVGSRGGGLREAFVSWRDGWFGEVLAAPSTPDLAATLAADGVSLREGQRAEVCLAIPAWVGAAGEVLDEDGLLVVIDYGHDAPELYGPQRQAGNLLTYRAHQVADDPFEAVGESDITTQVDLSALCRAAQAGGLDLVGRTTQARFLVDLGLGELIASLGRQATTDMADYLEARAAVARYLDPRHLGAFAVLAWQRSPAPGRLPLPGFGAGSPRVAATL